MTIKAAHSLVHNIKQLIRSQAQDKSEDEENNVQKKKKTLLTADLFLISETGSTENSQYFV